MRVLNKSISRLQSILVLIMIIQSCTPKNQDFVGKNYNLKTTSRILLTSESGDKMASQDNMAFRPGQAQGVIVQVHPEIVKQTLDGIGSSFTESAAFVLAHLDKDARRQVMETAFGEKGANFSLARTHIGSCDFCVEGKYSYADQPDDRNLESFAIAPDKQGFSQKKYPGIVDQTYDLLPMIKEALAIKANQPDQELRIISSAWTAPKWMKDINEWYIPGTAQNKYQGTGGTLRKEYIATYADYLLKYLQAYRREGVNIWALTAVNEPHGNNGQWESMHFTPETQNDFIKNHLGPRLKSSDHADTRLLIYDQNRDGMQRWTDIILGDPETQPFVYGTAVHWYESTFKVYQDVLDAVHDRFPGFAIIHTEGCIDDLGKEAPSGIGDPHGFQESGWFENDSFWWNPSATDWAYSAAWAENPEDHPAYTPVHRYARNIIVSIDHWMQGWIDWNLVLDHNGGPNHVGNFCGAPIMIHTERKKIYYTPIFYILAQFSKTMRPGDRAVQTRKQLCDLDADALHACATVDSHKLLSVQLLNTTVKPILFNLQIGGQYAPITIASNSVQTIQVQL
ncbi:MAG TPA: glycosyl hydrolase [bacterium]|nr:glycosyl hydrolase [bacterium]HOX86864.1 glycosyl hydrolase [bacterium]HPG47019.1 glycosyl hydrolase [bacterium]